MYSGATEHDISIKGDAGACLDRELFGSNEDWNLLNQYIYSIFDVTFRDLMLPTRGCSDIAFIRQIAMYLGHVALRRSLTDVGKWFDRDRTTVAYACKKIEDNRDDPELDTVLSVFEEAMDYTRKLMSARQARRFSGGN